MKPSELVDISRVRALTASGAARAVRVAAGLSLGEVARAVQCSPSTVLRWERGERVPHGPPAVRYGKLLAELMATRR